MRELTARYSALIGSIAAIAVSIPPAHGANITRNLMDSGSPREVVLEGRIEAGDYDKLKRIYGDIEKLQFHLGSGLVNQIFLASPGGDLVEAMKIGHLIRTLKLETIVPSRRGPGVPTNYNAFKLKNPKANNLCASACFFMFVAGIKRTTEFDDPLLGLHRPYLSDNDLKTLSADQAINSANRVRTAVAGYLTEMNVPSKYVDFMFSVPKDKIQWIGKEVFKSDFEGPITGLKEWLSAKCDTRTEVEKAIWAKLMADRRPVGTRSKAEEEISTMMFRKMSEIHYCESKSLNQMSGSAWLQMFDPTCTNIAPPARALIAKYWDSPSVCGQAK